MDFDLKLNKIGLKHVNGFLYNVGYYLFDAIDYLLGYLRTLFNPKDIKCITIH